MHIAIIGASSGIGLLSVKQALERGHSVSSLSRNISTLPDNPQLNKISGSATETKDLKKAIAGADAIIISIGKRKDSPPTLFTDTARALIEVMQESAAAIPVLVVTGFGAGDSLHYTNSWLVKLVAGFILKKEYQDKNQHETMLAASRLNWEIVRPALLSNGPLTGRYKVIPELYRGIQVKKISRADVAHFLLDQAEKPGFVHRYVALSGL